MPLVGNPMRTTTMGGGGKGGGGVIGEGKNPDKTEKAKRTGSSN